MGLRYKRANVTHKELGVTVQLPIISVKKNPQNPLYTQLGVLTRGTVIEVNVSELGLTSTSGKIVCKNGPNLVFRLMLTVQRGALGPDHKYVIKRFAVVANPK
jgi:hypothetical protein